MLLRNGPTGGIWEMWPSKKGLVAGTDRVATDAYVAKAYWNLDAEHLRICEWPPRADWTRRTLQPCEGEPAGLSSRLTPD